MHYQLKITLQGIDPPVWRRVLVPSEFTLLDLHYVIQVAMGWEDCHLHEFIIKRQRYGSPDPGDFGNLADEGEAMLRDVVAPRSKFEYQYDFGDSWKHVVLVEKSIVDPAPAGPTCIAGARACPPEDSGGPWGYADKLQALSDPDDEEKEEAREWLGDDFDPEQFDLAEANEKLQKAFQPAPPKKTRKTRKK